MASTNLMYLVSASPLCYFSTQKLSSSERLEKRKSVFFLGNQTNFSPWLSSGSSNLGFGEVKPNLSSTRGLRSICFFNAGEKSKKESGLDWPILKRWEVPWEWQTISLTSLACGLSFVLTGLVEATAIPYLGIRIEELSLDEKAEILFVGQGITTAVVLGVIYGIANSYQPLPEDFLRYDLREPFNLKKGWLLWAGVGLAGAVAAIALTGTATSLFGGESPKRETDALVQLLPLIGTSSVSTACLVGITGVLAPLLEETVFRGFFMASLTKWVPTPVAVIISAAVFALAHLTPGEFPQLFVLGAALGLSYAQTHNLLTPITIHAFWNSGVILLLTFLQLQGYDIKELLQST
ncbi:CAAX amino terminal protease [Quillaja saponaria]|uniref:CAAX amino terminal protease n=1 Tax=Quillaja saponaria TaxID=32244 RepID=A0AAD7PG94_QUISA|nr:CAAX amino terminal protease [Quillaja saponaria]KAJ7953805.1 CAAX amino terminal protease [Quillaja saponaria]